MAIRTQVLSANGERVSTFGAAREAPAGEESSCISLPGCGKYPGMECRLTTGVESENSMNRQSVMKMQGVILGCVLFLVTPLFAGDDSDVIVMKNGDRFTGEIKGLSGGVLYISVQSILGTSQVQWSKVASPGKQAVVYRKDAGRGGVHRVS